ncbi:MAG: di-heme-cytochrome C peroxidase, partial [Pseudomonadota bacterium]
TDQGSRLIPYDLFLNLEQETANKLFRDPVNLLQFGLTPSFNEQYNPDNLPIGFSRNEDYLGITCAACHTQHVKYDNKVIRIDGGQPHFDLQLFLKNLEQAMQANLSDAEKLARYISRYQEQDNSKTTEAIKQQLADEQLLLKELLNRNHTDVAYGFTRLDAFGAILNKGLYLTGVKDNYISPNAPTSYPYIWDTPQHDYVEWNGSQSNNGPGALARNVGEAIGVFGHVGTAQQKLFNYFDLGYESSIQTSNLRALEKLAAKLYSPLWPDSFPKIDQTKAQAGRVHFEQYCSSCHLDIDRTDPNRLIQVRMSSVKEVGTEALMAQNVLDHRGKTGVFEGKKRFYSFGEVMGDEAPALHIVNHIMVGVLKNNPLQVLFAKRDAKRLGHAGKGLPEKILDGELVAKGEESSAEALLAYKARPLNGIWSAAPYLHNGSVPNLYQLLLPASERDKTFYIGSWEFDPIDVGYVKEQAPGAFLFDTSLPGNSNAGHEYGTGEGYAGLPKLTELQLRELVEYLKTL